MVGNAGAVKPKPAVAADSGRGIGSAQGGRGRVACTQREVVERERAGELVGAGDSHKRLRRGVVGEKQPASLVADIGGQVEVGKRRALCDVDNMMTAGEQQVAAD